MGSEMPQILIERIKKVKVLVLFTSVAKPREKFLTKQAFFKLASTCTQPIYMIVSLDRRTREYTFSGMREICLSEALLSVYSYHLEIPENTPEEFYDMVS